MSSRSHATVQSTKRLSEKDLETVRKSDHDQREFKNLVATSRDYSETEKAVFKFDTFTEFDAFWKKTNDAKEDFDRRHEKGCGLWSKSYQSSAVVARSFMKDFAPIIDIVRDFGAPYGGMAVGTVSVLFAVAGNKDDMEQSLASAIFAIKDRLPGLNLYQHIYNDNHELDMRLQARIVSAYHGFIGFCIEASKYYKGGGPRRWLKAFGRPNSVLDKVNKVQSDIVDIRRLCDELLDKNVHIIKQLNLDQKVTIEGLEEQIKQLLGAQDNSMLTEIQRLLSLSNFSYENHRKELDKYREALASDEQLNAAYFEQMQGRRLDLFKAGKDYQSWMKSELSCLLILSGHNNRGILDIDQCWLSPVAMTLIQDFSPCPSHLAYSYYVFLPQGELLYRSLSVILLQLLNQKRQVLRNKSQYDEFRAELYELQKIEQQGKNIMDIEDERLSAFHKVALRVMNFFHESENVYIIMDRADRCCDLKKGFDHRKPLLKTLVKMVEAARCKLKVLVVINGDQWDVERRQDELGEKMKGRLIVHTAEQGDSP